MLNRREALAAAVLPLAGLGEARKQERYASTPIHEYFNKVEVGGSDRWVAFPLPFISGRDWLDSYYWSENRILWVKSLGILPVPLCSNLYDASPSLLEQKCINLLLAACPIHHFVENMTEFSQLMYEKKGWHWRHVVNKPPNVKLAQKGQLRWALHRPESNLIHVVNHQTKRAGLAILDGSDVFGATYAYEDLL